MFMIFSDRDAKRCKIDSCIHEKKDLMELLKMWFEVEDI